MKTHRFLFLVSLSLFILSCSKGGVYPLRLRYQSLKEFPSLQQKVGPTLAIAPFKDERLETFYIGIHSHPRGSPVRFKSDPFPLERAIKESLTVVLSRQGVKTVSVSHWDGRPESLKDMESDSALTIEIKDFWLEGRAAPFRTNAGISIHFIIHLGVKKEGKVFTKNFNVEKEMVGARLTPERAEGTINQILTEIFDSFFFNPY